MVSTDSQSCFPRLDDFHLHTKCNVLKVSCLLDSIVLEVSFWSRVDWFSIILFFILFRLFACFVFFVCTVFCCDYCYLVMVITGHCNFFWTPASMHCIFSWSWSYSPKGAFRGELIELSKLCVLARIDYFYFTTLTTCFCFKVSCST